MKWSSDRMILNVAGAILALVAIAWILLGSSVTANTPIVRIGTWTPLPASGHAP
jgi:hypothetical protein